MKILIVHNAYQQRGGEDMVAEAEASLLRNHGNVVLEYRRHNDELNGMAKLSALMDTMWSRKTTSEVGDLLRREKPDVIHVHNTFPLISPSVYWVAAAASIPIVQTLHNFRLLCPQAMLLREERICEDCVGHVPIRGVINACYRSSRTQSMGVASMLTLHRAIGTWAHKVDRFIALNEFCRSKFVAGGLPVNKISIKPNFVDLPAPQSLEREGFLFVGRLSQEKGISVLRDGVRRTTGLKVRVLGKGPQEYLLQGEPNIDLRGAVQLEQISHYMNRAQALVLPSIWYENFPRTLVEAFASGLPVIASRIGALAELIEDGVTGLLFNPGDPIDLAAKLQWASFNSARLSEMGRQARVRYESEYAPDKNYQRLMSIYAELVPQTGGAKAARVD